MRGGVDKPLKFKMLLAAAWLQLTIWITAIHAFYIWHPEAPCHGASKCENKPSRRDEIAETAAPVERSEQAEGVTFKLVQRIPDVSTTSSEGSRKL